MKRLASTLVLLVVSATAEADLVEVVPPEVPISVVVTMNSGALVRFTLSERLIEKVEVVLARRTLVADLKGCGLTAAVHLSTLALSRGETDRSVSNDYDTLLFDVGQSADVRFGEMPRVQLSWSKGELLDPLITRKTASSSWFSDQLCKDRPNNSLERSRER